MKHGDENGGNSFLAKKFIFSHVCYKTPQSPREENPLFKGR